MSVLWSEFLSVGIPEMDEQHRGLFAMIGDLDDLLATFESKPEDATAVEKFQEVFEGLIHYTQSHFEEEEALMRESGFPHVEEHCQEHAAFLAKIQKENAHFGTAPREATLELHHYLCHWLAHHIAQEDKNYGRFILQNE